MRRTILGAAILGLAAGSYAQEIQNPDNGHFYSLVDAVISGTDAYSQLQVAAEAAGGNLVTIRNAQENQWLVDTFSPLTLNGDVYIGFNDIDEEGTFAWFNGEPVTYTNWGGGEPNNSGNEDAAELDMESGTWNDIDLVEFQPGIMERIVFMFRQQPAGGGLVEEGENVVLSAEAWGNIGAITYQWQKDGMDLGGETSASLTLTNVTIADEGSYTLVASDSSKADITSNPVSITVVAPGSLPVGTPITLAVLAALLGLASLVVLRRAKS